jgi:hypothetical protein
VGELLGRVLKIQGRIALVAATAVGLVGCVAGGSGIVASSSSTAAAAGTSTARTRAANKSAPAKSAAGTSGAGTSAVTTPTTTQVHAPAPYPRLLSGAFGSGASGFTAAISWRGHTAVRVAHTTGGVTLIAFDQRLVRLNLHAGTSDPGGSGWRYGPWVAGGEARRLVVAFNGGFKLNTDVGGFMYGGRVGWPLSTGLGSIVTYANGRTDIGSWHVEVPAAGLAVASVRQNLPLLIDHGAAAANIDCVTCWGATLGGVSAPARSALGVTANGTLVWAGGEHLTPAQLAAALLSAHVVRAVQGDINPEWVAAYFYGHRGGHGPPAPVTAVPGQNGVPGDFLAPYSRDFFAIVAR